MKELPYKYGYSVIPWQLLDLVSSNAYKSFGKIYQAVFMSGGEATDGVEIPTVYFTQCVVQNKTRATSAIEELKTLGVVTVNKLKHKKTIYHINWEELNFLHEQLCNINNEGREYVKKMIFEREHLPLSKFSPESLEAIRNLYGMGTKCNQSDTVSYKMYPSNEDGYKMYPSLGTKCNHPDSDTQDSATAQDDEATNEGMVTKCNYRSVQNVTNNSGMVTKCTLNKRDKEKEKLSDERSESYIEGKIEKTSEENQDEETSSKYEKTEEEFEADRRRRKKMMEEYHKNKFPDNPYKDKPYLSKEALKDLADKLDDYVDSPVKLLYYNLFSGLYDFYDSQDFGDIELEADGETEKAPEKIGSFETIPGMLLTLKEWGNILTNAVEDTKGQLEVGYIEFADDTRIKVKRCEFPDIQVQYLCDWQYTIIDKSIEIQLDKWRNIEAEDIKHDEVDTSSMSHRERTRLENVRNRQYALCLMKADNSTLTTLESLQKQFMEQYVKIDMVEGRVEDYMNNNGEILECDPKMLPIHHFTRFFPVILKSNIKLEDFYKTIYMAQGEYKKGMDIKGTSNTFSYQATQRLNQLLNMQSQITIEKLEETLPSNL